jgi:colanic acid biosynthesis glycosyl transferase WcaI
MRFLFITQFFRPEPGACASRLAGVVRELIRSGHEAEIVTALPNHPLGNIYPGFQGCFYRSEIWEGTRIHRTWLYSSLGSGFRRYLNYLSFTVTSTTSLFKSRKPDFIFVESPPPLLAVTGVLASSWWHVPLILNVSDLWPDAAVELGLIKPGMLLSALWCLEAWAYEQATFVCAVTEGIKHRLTNEKGLPQTKMLFLPNGVDTDLYKPVAPDEDLRGTLGLRGKTILLYAGTVGYAHAAEKFLHAAKLLSETDVHFLFVGGGSATEDLKRLADQLRLGNVSFVPSVEMEQVKRFLSIAYCGLASVRTSPVMLGSRPAKMFAAMACAKPVLYAGDGEGARLLEEAGAGIVVRDPDPSVLAEAIRDLVANTALASRLGHAGRKYVEDHLTWTTLIRSWLDQLTSASAATTVGPVLHPERL